MTLRGEMLRWEWSYVKWLTSFQRTSTTEHTTRQIRVPDTTNIDGHQISMVICRGRGHGQKKSFHDANYGTVGCCVEGNVCSFEQRSGLVQVFTGLS